ncbi:hypothetical protein D3C72_976900 [compost metagenome]
MKIKFVLEWQPSRALALALSRRFFAPVKTVSLVVLKILPSEYQRASLIKKPGIR